MRRIILGLMTATLVVGTAAWAQERDETTTTGATTAEASEVTQGYLTDEIFSVKPLVGVIAYRDLFTSDTNTSRGALGLSMDYNASAMLGETMQRNWYLGPSVGFIYSHLGSPGSNFFGSAPDVATGGNSAPGANILIIPTNLKFGYNIADSLRISAHGGGNVIYRSVASSMNLDTDSASQDSLWKYYPNVGGDLDIGFGKNVALSLRPDVTFTPNENFFMGTLGLGVALG
ncbi:MAG: hypothetical protein A2428_07115 [Bdellovibrionales bacterium RIFOXYC1_FULL_54_43]|nr:MAG: hypothetical protein A2428_07115 [Bdellovibrionales bacterium RIFOXYC1_FULL_54_43]